MELLKQGQADGLLMDNTTEFWLMYEDITASDFYPLIYKGKPLTTADPELSPIIDVMEQFLIFDGQRDGGPLLQELYSRGHEDYMQHAFSKLLTDEEKRYIEEKNRMAAFVLPTKLMSFSNYKEQPIFQAGMVFDDSYESKFGLTKENAILASILDKGYRMIDAEAISVGWNYKSFDYQKKRMRCRFPICLSAARCCCWD